MRTPARRPSKARGFVFTINNPTDGDRAEVQSLAQSAKYACYAPEVGANGTPHIQGYVYFANQRSFSSVKSLLTRAHVEAAGGTAEENRAYILGPYSKDGKEKPFNPDAREEGELPRQGKRSDIDSVKSALAEGKTARQIVLEDVTSYQALQFMEKGRKYFEKPRNFQPIVEWYHGSTGVGKTRYAYEKLTDMYGEDNIYTCMNDSKWWEGYDGHPAVVIDDMRGDFAKFHVLLRILDRYPYRVETKGGSRQLLAQHIIITCNKTPRDLYLGKTDEDIQQLLRRITDVVHFPESTPWTIGRESMENILAQDSGESVQRVI